VDSGNAAIHRLRQRCPDPAFCAFRGAKASRYLPGSVPLQLRSAHVTSDQTSHPVWDAEHLRVAMTAAGVSLWSWNVGDSTF
jgi:hypothetical protein